MRDVAQVVSITLLVVWAGLLALGLYVWTVNTWLNVPRVPIGRDNGWRYGQRAVNLLVWLSLVAVALKASDRL